MTWLQRAAVFLPLSLLAITATTLIVLACQPDPNKPEPRIVILPAAAPKSLITWLELEQTTSDQAAYTFRRPYKEPPFHPLAFYAGSEQAENLIAERVSFGHLRWGPKAMDTPYEVTWRGLGEIHLHLPEGATDQQIAEWTAQIQRCEPMARVVILAE
jgi:hypothetical protein